jgi:hypothetical protein
MVFAEVNINAGFEVGRPLLFKVSTFWDTQRYAGDVFETSRMKRFFHIIGRRMKEQVKIG